MLSPNFDVRTTAFEASYFVDFHSIQQLLNLIMRLFNALQTSAKMRSPTLLGFRVCSTALSTNTLVTYCEFLRSDSHAVDLQTPKRQGLSYGSELDRSALSPISPVFDHFEANYFFDT